jgi:chromosome segregation ATPase
MTDQIKLDVQAAVDEALKSREEAELLKETEEALAKSAEKINELTASLEAKGVEISEFVSKVEKLEGTVAELSDKVTAQQKSLDESKTAFDAEKVELVKRAETAEAELANIKKDQLAKTRFEDLKKDGVAATEEKAVTEQFTRIKEMSDEEFAAYKSERVELRKSILAELEKAAQEKATQTSTEDETKKKEEEKVTAEIVNSSTAIDPMKAVAAALNMEVKSSDTVRAKYSEAGKFLADRIKNRKEKKSGK